MVWWFYLAAPIRMNVGGAILFAARRWDYWNNGRWRVYVWLERESMTIGDRVHGRL